MLKVATNYVESQAARRSLNECVSLFLSNKTMKEKSTEHSDPARSNTPRRDQILVLIKNFDIVSMGLASLNKFRN